MATGSGTSARSTNNAGLLAKGVQALLKDESFTLNTAPAMAAREIAEQLRTWIPGHQDKVSQFEAKLVDSLSTCMHSNAKSHKVRREKMWTRYHTLRTSTTYHTEWQTFLTSSASVSTVSPMFYQYVGNFIFKELICEHFPIEKSSDANPIQPLTYDETNALRYAAGYIPRALKKKLPKSAHPLKEDIQLCILDLLDDGDEEKDESQDWIQLADRGGLTRVNNTTFEVFVAMEYELRRHIRPGQQLDLEHIVTAITENEDVLFLWSLISADWDDNSSSELLQMVTRQWVKIRGFSYASAWLEKYKVGQKRTTQKSKGVRKQLISKPKNSQGQSTPAEDLSDSD